MCGVSSDPEGSAGTNVAVIAVADGGATASGGGLREAILGALLEPDARVVIDLSAVTFVDAGLLSALTAAATAAGASRMAIVCPESHRARQMFRMTALDSMFAVCETRADAVRALSAA